jgi:hypothetical protein
MKKILFLACTLFPMSFMAQTVFWTEDFGAVVTPPCDQGLLANLATTPNGQWALTNTGTNGGEANTWYISASENGNDVGQCGTICGTDRTLHISHTFYDQMMAPLPVDQHAVYYIAGAFGASMCGSPPIIPGIPYIGCGVTDKRIESPTINCTGRSDITVSFHYIEGGTANDNATLWYSADNGGTWSQLADMPKTAVCNTSHGIWAEYSTTLPASANNNPQVKIGFRWINAEDDPGASDPSIAIDNITLSEIPVVVNCCPGDFNCDGVVNALDMIILVNQFGCMSGCTADLDADNVITAADITLFNGLYGDICP